MTMASVVGCTSYSSSYTLPLLKPATKTTLFAGKMSFSFNSNTVSNGSRIACMQVLNPHTNLKFETLSYLPPLSPDQIAKQVDYIVANGWIPCLEFDKIGIIAKTNFQGSGYYDHRYWTMWKLPMFGCKESAKVLSEIEECKEAYPQCFVRLLGFDPKRQVQVIGFLVQKPTS